MVFKEILPDERLRKEVNCFWYYKNETLHTVERVIPDGCIEVVFHLGNLVERATEKQSQINPRCNIIGQLTQPYQIKTMGKVDMVGIRFYPYGAARFFDFPLRDIKNRVLSTEIVWKQEAVYLEERIMESGTYQQAIVLIEQFLLDRRKSALPSKKIVFIEMALKKILQTRGVLRVEQVAKNMGISRRYLEMLFRDYVGISPKNFSSIVQFQQIFSALKQPDIQSLTQLAYQCDYADQAHFTRTCKKMTGATPKEFFKESSLIHQNFRSEDHISHLFNF